MSERLLVDVTGGRIDVEIVGPTRPGPTLVFLHEGLGAIDLWRGVPAEIAAAAGGLRAVVYSRLGYGHSTAADLPRPVEYMHHEADVVLPEVLDALGVESPVLVGHSDGASIALAYAGAGGAVVGIVCLAPHVFVEPETIAGIEAARVAFESTDMVARMARYHDDPAATFRGWNDVWLSPAFVDWSIEDRLPAIAAPILLVQGTADDYGTFAQLDAIERTVTGPVERLEVDGAGHSPHLDARPIVVDAVTRFVSGL